MSYRLWWLIAFWALGVGAAIELEVPKGERNDAPRAEARAPLATVATRTSPGRGG